MVRTTKTGKVRTIPIAQFLANVKAVGLASAAMTLVTYADLFDDDLDYVASALSRVRQGHVVVIREAAATPMISSGEQPESATE